MLLSMILSLTVANFASFLWSVIGVFRSQRERLRGSYLALQVNSLLLWIASVYTEATWPPLAPGLAIGLIVTQVFCLVTFWFHSRIVRRNHFSVVFSKDVPQRLIQEGFYRRVRHPFYMIYLISYFSVALTYVDPVLIALSTTMGFIYYRAAKFEESKFLESALAEEYSGYQRRTYMFGPKVFGRNESHGSSQLGA